MRLQLSQVLSHCLFCIGFLVSTIGLSQETVVQPKPKPGALDNPLKGWCPYADAGPIHQPYSMVFQYVSWKELEPQKGNYHFDEWEKIWDKGLSQGKHIVFRVYVDYPTKPSGLPDWLREAGVKETKYSDYGGGMSPDYNDPKMVAAMQQFITALGRRYNKNPRIAFIQLGLLGHWGEWHTYPRTELYASKETERKIIDSYRKAFPNKSLMVRYARDYAGKQDWIGFHDDMFPEDTDNGEDWSFLAGIRKSMRTKNWMVAVVGGEMVPDKARKWLGLHFDNTLKMVQRSHFSWIGPYCPALERTTKLVFKERSKVLVRRLGYDFQINKVTLTKSKTSSTTLQVSIVGENKGVAPFYYPWPVEFSLIDSKGIVVRTFRTNWDIRKWQPGEFNEKVKIHWGDSSVRSKLDGTFDLAIGIIDPWKKEPAISFANEMKTQDGWAIISKIKLVQ